MESVFPALIARVLQQAVSTSVMLTIQYEWVVTKNSFAEWYLPYSRLVGKKFASVDGSLIYSSLRSACIRVLISLWGKACSSAGTELAGTLFAVY